MQSIAAMYDREVLFKYALDEYITARRNHIVRAYIDALVRGGHFFQSVGLLIAIDQSGDRIFF